MVKLRNSTAIAPEPDAPDVEKGCNGDDGNGDPGYDARYRDKLLGLQASREHESGSPVLYLRDVLQDAYEYHGVSQLGLFTCTFVLATCCLFSHWDERYAVFRSQVQQSTLQFTLGNATRFAPTDVKSMYDSVAYMQDYARWLLGNSEQQGHPYAEITLHDYVKIRAIRFIANIDTPCHRKMFPNLHCYKEDQAAAIAANTTPPALSDGWLLIPQDIYPIYVYSMDRRPVYQLTVLASDGKEAGGASYAAALERVDAVNADLHFLARYAMDVNLELLAQSALHSGGKSSLYSVFCLRATRQVSVYALPYGGKLDNKVMYSTVTSSLRTSIAGDWGDVLIHILTAALLTANSFYLLYEAYEIRLCYYQHWLSDKSYTWGGALGHYLRNVWNTVDIFSSLVSLAWCMAWFGLLVQHAWAGVSSFAPTTEYTRTYATALSWGQAYATFLYAGMLNNFLLAIRIYQYMQVHSGLRVYYNLFLEALRSIKDFMFWFLTVLFALSFITLALFQVTGGNPDFAYNLSGIAAMARLTFNFYDYNSFINYNLGVGDWQSLVVFIFWLTVILLIVVAQNIVLAMIVDAYQVARLEEGQVEATMLRIVFMRIYWYAWYAAKVWLVDWRLGLGPWTGGLSLSAASDSWSEYVVAKLCDEAGAHKRHLTKRLLLRWAVALVPEVRTVLAFYSDAGTLKVYSAPVWANPDVTEKHKLLMQYKNRRRWISQAEYPSFVDMLMTGTASVQEYLESGLDCKKLAEQNALATLNLWELTLKKKWRRVETVVGQEGANLVMDTEFALLARQRQALLQQDGGWGVEQDAAMGMFVGRHQLQGGRTYKGARLKVEAMARMRGVFGGEFFTWRTGRLERVATLAMLVYGSRYGEDDFSGHPLYQAPYAVGVPMAAVSQYLPKFAKTGLQSAAGPSGGSTDGACAPCGGDHSTTAAASTPSRASPQELQQQRPRAASESSLWWRRAAVAATAATGGGAGGCEPGSGSSSDGHFGMAGGTEGGAEAAVVAQYERVRTEQRLEALDAKLDQLLRAVGGSGSGADLGLGDRAGAAHTNGGGGGVTVSSGHAAVGSSAAHAMATSGHASRASVCNQRSEEPATPVGVSGGGGGGMASVGSFFGGGGGGHSFVGRQQQQQQQQQERRQPAAGKGDEGDGAMQVLEADPSSAQLLH